MPALIATEAQAAWGCIGTPELLSHRENAVFAVTLPDGARAALRVHRVGYKTIDEIAAELALCDALAAAGFPCPRGQRTEAGDWIWQGPGAAVASVVTWVEGAPLGQGDAPLPPNAPALYEALGALLARLHTASPVLDRSPGRQGWDLDGLTGPEPIWGRYWESPILSEAEASMMVRARDFARDRLQELTPAAQVPLIHGDALRENVLVTEQGLALIDFDDCGPGFRLYDVATALTQSLDEPCLPDLRDAVLRGYEDVSPLGAAERAALPLLSTLRSFCALAWVMPRYPSGHPKGPLYKARALRAAEAVLAGEDFLSVRR
ncbi:phosphotransferase enzyme family protein [Dinoroseobacter sp. S375]|uniref:phosphotransferase enzyme family protein n=1 Tax=Dinoroseobacter sp. S375 TaxID=3415136 RepID=UPI003C79F22C